MTQSFDALGVAPLLVRTLVANAIEVPFPIQALTIPDALKGSDVCGKAKTGSGKTLAFGLPLLQRLVAERLPTQRPATRPPTGPRGLVLVPTRELARQVGDVLTPLAEAVGIRLAVIYGGTSMNRQVASLKAGADIVVATPGRLIDLHQRGDICFDATEIVVLDEADRMADMGFLPPVEWILRRLPTPRQTMLFSATLDGEVDYLVKHYLADPVHHQTTDAAEPVPAMQHRFIAVYQLDKVKVVAAIAKGATRTLVFARTKRGADRLTRDLREAGVRASAIHGDLQQRVRERALADFTKGKLPVLVATDVAARGIDVAGIDIVIHFDPPEDNKGYVHRSGRTARAGQAGLVVTLVLWDQHVMVERIQKMLGISPPVVEMLSNDPRLRDLRSWDPAAASVA